MTALTTNLGHPYLSVVVTTRNDDHGGNPLGRTQAFINGLVGQCKRHQLPAELIIVEWNPPADRPPLKDVLDWPDDGGYCPVRIIEVPPALHARLRHGTAMPLYQMIGKNVGIRRAHGEFVLATNIDILFSDELMRFMAERRLQPDKMYRLDRTDVSQDVPVKGTVDEQLAYCESHVIRINAREGTHKIATNGRRAIDPNDVVSPASPVVLGMNWFELETFGEPYRWVANDGELIVAAGRSERGLLLDIAPGPGVNNSPFELELRDASGAMVSQVRVRGRGPVVFDLPPAGDQELHVFLHTDDGGRRIPEDVRTLNFRVFKCSLTESATLPQRETAKKTSVASVPQQRGLRERIGRGLLRIRAAANGKPWLNESAIEIPSTELFPRGLNMIFGEGWYPLEHFNGQAFHWMQDRADIVWLAPPDAPEAIFLNVEPGPMAGYRACKVTIRDQWDSVIATHQVSGRTEIRVPMARHGGPLITSFEVHGSSPARAVKADPRNMALRLCGVRWEPGPAETPPLDSGELKTAAPGVWCVNGWRNTAAQKRFDGITATPGADLLLHAPETGARTLLLEIAPPTAGATADVVVEDSLGNQVFRGCVNRRTQVKIDRPLLGGRHYALRLRRGSPDLDGADDREWLVLSAICWETEKNPARARIPLYASIDYAEPLHTNACGDFTLVARDRWMDLRAYPELDLYSWNIDSIFCWMAHHGGAREEVLRDPMRIYHIEHGLGSGWTPEGAAKLFDRLEAHGISWVEYTDVVRWACVMNRFDAPMIFNHDDWGFANEDLKETDPRNSRKSEKVSAV